MSGVKTDLRLNWLVAVAIIGWLMYLLAPVLTPFIAAALLAYIGDPLADRLQRLKLPRTLAVITVFLLTLLLIGLLVLLVGPLIRDQVQALFAAIPGIIVEIEQVWMPRVAGMLDVPLGDDVGLGAFLAQYKEMAGSWGAKILGSVTIGDGAVIGANAVVLDDVPAGALAVGIPARIMRRSTSRPVSLEACS